MRLAPFRIRRAKSRDFDSIFPLQRQLWSEKKLGKEGQRQIFLDGLHANDLHYLVAKRKGEIVGYASLSITPNLLQDGYAGHLDELVVDENHRKNGIGTALLKKMMAIARKNGCESVELESAFHRKDAHGFYVSRGFDKWAFMFFKKSIRKKSRGNLYRIYSKILSGFDVI